LIEEIDLLEMVQSHRTNMFISKIMMNQNQRELIKFMGKYCADMNEVNRVKIWKNPRESLLMFNPTSNKTDNSLYKSIVLKSRLTSVEGMNMLVEDQEYEGIEITPDVKTVIDAWIADVKGIGERKSEFRKSRPLLNNTLGLSASDQDKSVNKSIVKSETSLQT
jgi:hypothetical protein